ncbi:phage conserved hypothetical protein [Azospira oryzae PS]|uniref:Bacteriophage phiJL001 Gp84 C-terminal domain-containing protein n=1 Tax=Azospira oryzae (strain ATCC BAA-33 / DSM 13638 / PS) TaxID=640081 RepID=G8QMP6_AZOOP|nr:DUF2163 domain-containing protein [Azospira oryzae]AEV24626.1 phage conserved hypothetical protein [Azospira oryzae PS]
MKAASPELIALLAQSQFLMADLYTLTLKSGEVKRYTSADIDITLAGNTFIHDGPLIQRDRTRTVVGIEVDTLQLTINPKTTDLLNGVPFLKACRNGALDGATLLLQKAFMASWGDTAAGAVTLFSGRVSGMMFSRTQAQIEVKSDTELLNIMLPRNTCQPTCLNTLFDAGCGLAKSGWQQTGALQAGSTQGSFNVGLTNFPDGWFALGTILFTTGINAGVMVTIKRHAAGVVTPSIPLISPPSTGDQFTIVPGCDRRQATCGNTYARVFTANASTDQLASAGHTYADGDRVVVSNTGGALPGGLSAGTIYYVVSAVTDAFKVSLTYNGSPVNITSAGSGTHKVRSIGKFDNLARFRGFPYVPIPETAL